MKALSKDTEIRIQENRLLLPPLEIEEPAMLPSEIASVTTSSIFPTSSSISTHTSPLQALDSSFLPPSSSHLPSPSPSLDAVSTSIAIDNQLIPLPSSSDIPATSHPPDSSPSSSLHQTLSVDSQAISCSTNIGSQPLTQSTSIVLDQVLPPTTENQIVSQEQQSTNIQSPSISPEDPPQQQSLPVIVNEPILPQSSPLDDSKALQPHPVPFFIKRYILLFFTLCHRYLSKLPFFTRLFRYLQSLLNRK